MKLIETVDLDLWYNGKNDMNNDYTTRSRTVYLVSLIGMVRIYNVQAEDLLLQCEDRNTREQCRKECNKKIICLIKHGAYLNGDIREGSYSYNLKRYRY